MSFLDLDSSRRSFVVASRRLCGVLLIASLATPLKAQFAEGWTPIHSWTGSAAGETFGWVTEQLGDLDGDGARDFAVGATGFGSGQGRVYVYSSRSGALLFQRTGAGGAALGYDVGPAGDFDGDGTEDVLASANQHAGKGAVFIYSGSDGALLRTFSGENGGDLFGYGATSLGDLGGDGVSEYLVGAMNHSSVAAGAGRAYVLDGASGVALQTFDGAIAGANLGSAVGLVGDLDGDTVVDFVVGAQNDGPGAIKRGRAYVYSGATGALVHTLAPQVKGRSFGLYFAAGAGDVDADGTPDIFVGDIADIEFGTSSGKAYVFSGASGGLLHCWTGTGTGAGMGPGRAAGDWDEDGHDDLFVAEWSKTTTAGAAGEVHLYSGRDGAELRRFTGTIGGANLGFDLHGMGDVNGDGNLDFLISAATQSGGRGVVHLVAGEPELFALDPGQAGVVNTLPARGAVPGSVVLLVVGVTAGATPIGQGVQLGLGAPFALVPAPVDPAGAYGLQGMVSANLSGTTLLIQTVDVGRRSVSNLLQHTFP